MKRADGTRPNFYSPERQWMFDSGDNGNGILSDSGGKSESLKNDDQGGKTNWKMNHGKYYGKLSTMENVL